MNEIRSCHWAAYRCGEWGRIIATDVVSEGVPSPRSCYLVAWPDGATDLWPVNDPTARYEFREATP